MLCLCRMSDDKKRGGGCAIGGGGGEEGHTDAGGCCQHIAPTHTTLTFSFRVSLQKGIFPNGANDRTQ
jgi:hypothetical protein